MDIAAGTLAGAVRETAEQIRRKAKVYADFVGGSVPEAVSGEPCPTCGRRVPMTGAERQRKWRERLRIRKDLAKQVGEPVERVTL